MNTKSRWINKNGCGRLLCLLVVTNLFFIITGCEIKEYKGKHYNVTSYNDFIKALQDKGYTVSEDNSKKGQPSEPLFTGNKRDINIEEELITVYEFSDSDTAKLESDSISKDGNNIGDRKIEWSSTPYFFQKGNLIVCYIGNNRTLIFDLSMILGHSIIEEGK